MTAIKQQDFIQSIADGFRFIYASDRQRPAPPWHEQ